MSFLRIVDTTVWYLYSVYNYFLIWNRSALAKFNVMIMTEDIHFWRKNWTFKSDLSRRISVQCYCKGELLLNAIEEYNQWLLLRCIDHFKSDEINNMDHMRISGTEPSSVILSQKSSCKIWQRCPESAKTSWSQKGWCNKPIELQFRSIFTRKILMLSNATNQPKSTVELGYMCPRGLLLLVSDP